MKKQYQKPTIEVVKIQQQMIICASPNGYDGQTIDMSSGTIGSEEDVW